MTRLKTIALWLCRFWYVQCFLSLFSLPILIAWGLPLSIYSPLGNLLFSPVIVIFLILSCLIFFCELLHLSCTPLLWLLERVADGWHLLLEQAQHTWLIGFAQPPLFILCAIPALALWCVFYMSHQPLWRKNAVITLLLLGSCGFLRFIAIGTAPIGTIPCNKGKLTLLHYNNQFIVIDPGYIGQRQSASSWVQFTLIPHIIRTTGHTAINHLILLYPTKTLLSAIALLCQKIYVKSIYLPKTANSSLDELLATIATNDTKITFLERTTVHLVDNDDWAPRLEPLETERVNNSLSTSGFAFHTTIDNQVVTIYPARYTKRNKDA